MELRILVSKGVRQAVIERLQQAYAGGQVRLIRRIHAVLLRIDGKAVAEVAALLELGGQTVRDDVHAFLWQGGSLSYTWAPKGKQPFVLPAHSPDFNPIEHLWKKVKKEATARVRAHD